jgi:hypothetical protein
LAATEVPAAPAGSADDDADEGADVPSAVPDGVPAPDRRDRATVLAWLALGRTGALAPGADVAATSLAWYDDLRMPVALVAGLHDTGFGEGQAWAIAEQVRVLLALPRPSSLHRPARTADARLVEAWLARDTIRVAIGINTWEGVEYVDRDRFADVLRWAVRLDAIEAGATEVPPAGEAFVTRLTAAADVAGYRVDRLREALADRPPAPKPDAARTGTKRPRGS